MPKSDIAFASQFTPAQIDLPLLLQLAKQHEGVKAAMTEAIRGVFFSRHASGDRKQQIELAKNPILGLKRYGLLDSDFRLTPVGLELLSLAEKKNEFYERLARHILLNLRGWKSSVPYATCRRREKT